MMNATLGDVIVSAKTIRCNDGKYPVLSMTMHDGIVLQNDRFKKSLASIDQSNYKVVKRGQLVVGFPIDEGVIYVQNVVDEGIMSPAYNVWDICTDKIVPEYLELCLHSPQSMDYYLSKLKGTTARRRSITTPDLLALPLYLPDHATQRKLVSIIRNCDRLISDQAEVLAKLDELVKSRFVELFGEWECNPEPLKLFLEDITYGFTNPMPDAEEGPWKITAKDVINGKVNYDTARKTTVQAFEELTAKSKPVVGDVLLTKDGTLGRCAVVEEDGICVNQSVAVLKCNEKILPRFLAILLQMPEYQREMLKNAGGGTIKHIYITKVVDMLIAVPTVSQQMEFLLFIEQNDKSKLAVQQSLEKLETLKKSLMQQYFG